MTREFYEALEVSASYPPSHMNEIYCKMRFQLDYWKVQRFTTPASVKRVVISSTWHRMLSMERNLSVLVAMLTHRSKVESAFERFRPNIDTVELKRTVCHVYFQLAVESWAAVAEARRRLREMTSGNFAEWWTALFWI